MRVERLLLLTATLALGACTTTPSTPERPLNVIPYWDIPMTAVPISCFSHPGVGYIHSFAVQEFFSKGMVGGFNCGGSVPSGYTLPDQWQPGMKVKVRWNRPIKGEDNWIEKTTTIRRYERVGTLFAHFFINDEVRVVSSGPFPGPHHPIPSSLIIAPPEEE